jgi:sialate O-acetylesterase
MVVTTDLEQDMNIHPPFKREVGKRISNLALYDDYGFINIIRSSPLYNDATFISGQSIIYFSEVGDGLKVLTG